MKGLTLDEANSLDVYTLACHIDINTYDYYISEL